MIISLNENANISACIHLFGKIHLFGHIHIDRFENKRQSACPPKCGVIM
jgi:hypothetical protein